MKESREDRFRRVAEARVNKIIKMVRLLGNCAGAAYAHTPDQVEQIFHALEAELQQAKERYAMPARKLRFSLSDSAQNEEDKPTPPTISLSLPDGTHLKAVAYDGESYPAINIYWIHGAEVLDDLICFAEYNPERSSDHRLCVGTYQSEQEDTTYYQPYQTAEREYDEENT